MRVIHTLGTWRLLSLFHQQAGGLGVGGGIGWVIWAYDHPDEGGSATWEIALDQSRHRESDHMFTWSRSCVSLSFLFTWNWSCVFMSRTEGFGWKEGCEWYQPTTLKPRDVSTSQACVWETGSISHCKPVLTLLHGSAAQICKHTESFVSKYNHTIISCRWLLLSAVFSYFQYFLCFIESSTQQADYFTPWHMGMLRITAHLMNSGIFRKRAYKQATQKKIKDKKTNSWCTQHTEETFFSWLTQKNSVFLTGTQRERAWECNRQYLEYSTITSNTKKILPTQTKRK